MTKINNNKKYNKLTSTSTKNKRVSDGMDYLMKMENDDMSSVIELIDAVKKGLLKNKKLL